MIPKVLHFTWKTEALPRVMGRYFARWKALHPSWEIRLWTDESMRRFVVETYPAFVATYDGYPRMIQRADAFRYLVLQHLGGVYADLDVDALEPIDGLTKVAAFIGVEPLEHVISDRIHAGLPFQLTNAFMGAEPGHPLFRLIVGLLPELADQAVFYSTGPAMVTAAVLRLPMEERPVLLLPKIWSPQRDGGMATRGDKRLRQMLAGVGTLFDSGTTLVSHKWMTTWVKWNQRYTPLQDIGQLPSRFKWWVRRRLIHRALGAVVIPDPLRLYADQRPVSASAPEKVFVGIRLAGGVGLDPELAAALVALEFPREMLTFGVDSEASGETAQTAVRRSVVEALGRSAEIAFSEPPLSVNAVAALAAANNRLLARGAAVAAKVLLVGGGVRQIPPQALAELLGVERPIVAASLRDEAGEPDLAVFRYNWGPDFRTLYKLGGVSGQVTRDRHFRYVPGDHRAFPLFALDGVGDDFVLIDRAAIEAGARFAERPHKLHLNGEAFAIMARDLGFESAALTGLVVRRQSAQAAP